MGDKREVKETRKQELARLDRSDTRRRAKLLRQTSADVLAAISNPDGLDRLRAISDEEWAEAVARDNEQGEREAAYMLLKLIGAFDPDEKTVVVNSDYITGLVPNEVTSSDGSIPTNVWVRGGGVFYVQNSVDDIMAALEEIGQGCVTVHLSDNTNANTDPA